MKRGFSLNTNGARGAVETKKNIKTMKTKTYLIVLAVIAIMLASCSVYSHGKQFKPDRHQVNNCHTYNDVK